MIEFDGDGPCGLHIGCGATSPDDCPIEQRILASLARPVAEPAPQPPRRSPLDAVIDAALASLSAAERGLFGLPLADAAALPVAAPCASPAARPRLPTWKSLPSR